MSSQTFTSAGFLHFPGVPAGSTVSASCAFSEDSMITPGAPLAVYVTVLWSPAGQDNYGPLGKPRSHAPVAVPRDGDVMVQVQPADGPCVGTVVVG